MIHLGTHVCCDFTINKDYSNHLCDPFRFKHSLVDSCEVHGATVLNVNIHEFEGTLPSGFTIVLSLAESHASIHTWPEHNAAAMDIYTCGDIDPSNILDTFFTELAAEGIEPVDKNVMRFFRGVK